MAVIKKSDINEDNIGSVDEFLDLMKTTEEIINDEIYDNEENIEQIRSELKEDIKTSEEEAKTIKEEFESNKEEKYNELMEVSSVNYIANKLKEELNSSGNSVNKKLIVKNIEHIEDSIYLNIFLSNIFIPKGYKVDAEKSKVSLRRAYEKLNSSNKYQFADIRDIKPIISSILYKEEYSKYLNSFIYYFCEFINRSRMDEYAVYISFIINNIKYISLFPSMEQNKILIESINKIFETYFCISK